MARIRDLNREHYWRQHHVRQRTSGLSIAAYCQRESISAAAFYAWRHRLGAASLPAVSRLTSFRTRQSRRYATANRRGT